MPGKVESALRILGALFALAIIAVSGFLFASVAAQDGSMFVSARPGNCPTQALPDRCLSYDMITDLAVPTAAGVLGLIASLRKSLPWTRAAALAISLMWVPSIALQAVYIAGHWDVVAFTALQFGFTSLLASLPFWTRLAYAGRVERITAERPVAQDT